MVDRVDLEVRLAPRIAREGCADRLLGLRLHGVDDAVLVGERPAQDDEPVLYEPVHEGGVLRPAGLLLHRPRRVPLRPRAKELEEEHRHIGLLAQAYRR